MDITWKVNLESVLWLLDLYHIKLMVGLSPLGSDTTLFKPLLKYHHTGFYFLNTFSRLRATPRSGLRLIELVCSRCSLGLGT